MMNKDTDDNHDNDNEKKVYNYNESNDNENDNELVQTKIVMKEMTITIMTIKKKYWL